MLAASRPSTNTGLIAFGSNQGDSLQVLKLAIDALQRIGGLTVVAHSQPAWTAPVTGCKPKKSKPLNGDQPYLNAVIRIETALSPSELLLQTAAIEHQFGRIRSGHWQARVIDLDILLLGDQIVETRSLILPHPRMSFRRFVLEPAAEIAAELKHPLAKCSIAELLKRINSSDKTMALICSESPKQVLAIENLACELSKIDLSWQIEKVFSAERFFQLDSNLTVVVTFDAPCSGAGTQWNNLREAAMRFAGPSLRLAMTPDAPLALTELTAVLQTIG